MKKKKRKISMEQLSIYLIVAVAVLVLYNQYQILSVQDIMEGGTGYVIKTKSSGVSLLGGKDLSDVNVNEIQSTAQAIAALFPVEEIETTQDAIDMMISTGTPEYGEAMGVSYDDPVGSMEKMASAYSALKKEVQQNSELWQRYLDLATRPVGISCEFCCGVGPTGIDKNGNSRCGCKHNPAVQTVTMWLMQNTDYNNAQILREVMKWKSIWFPKNMVGIAAQIAGGDTSVLKDLPGMVGGC